MQEVIPVNLSQLTSFLRVAETGNLSAAARELGLSQPAVSQQLRSLEEYLGVPLFERTRRRLVLTGAGQVLARRGRELLALARQTEEAVRQAGRGDTLHLAASSIPGEFLLPDLVRRFRDTHPDTAVQLSIGDTRTAWEQLSRGAADLAAVGALPEAPGTWQAHPFREDRLVLVVPPDPPWVGRAAVPPAALAGEPLVWREAGSGTRRTAEEFLAAQGVRPDELSIACAVESNEACLSAVAAGLGISILSRLVAAAAIAAGRVAEVPLAGPPIRRRFHLLVPKEPSAAARSFLDFLQSLGITS